MEDNGFLKYIKEQRNDFVKVVKEYRVTDHLKLRTEIDNLLIAYDQMAVKLSERQQTDNK